MPLLKRPIDPHISMDILSDDEGCCNYVYKRVPPEGVIISDRLDEGLDLIDEYNIYEKEMEAYIKQQKILHPRPVTPKISLFKKIRKILGLT